LIYIFQTVYVIESFSANIVKMIHLAI